MEKNSMKTKHGLPEKVIFCKRCLMSNQRPSSSPELRKTSSDIKTAGFSDDGICDACNYYDFKKGMDWEDREKQLKDLCDKFRRNDGRYDVVVPGSGGKDSIAVSHLLKYKYNMNPLTVTWAPHIYTDVGWRNMQNWLKAGFDNILVTPNPKVHAILTRLSFENLVNPFQPFIIGQRNIAPRIAAQHDIQFVMYGENQAEAHNSFNENMSPLMGVEHISRASLDDKLYFGGISMQDLHNNGIPLNELNPYLPILKENFIKKEIEVHYMSYYINWSPQANYYYAKEHANFESNPDGRSEGTYSKYASIDDRLDGQHYFTMYAKFGQGRTMNDANRDIRDGFISREEGLALMNKYDGEFPQKYFQEALDYMGITEERYWEVINNSRSPHLWKKIGGKWTLLHPTS